MQCHCQKRAFYIETIKQQQETISLLQQFIDKEKQAHLQEIRVIKQSLEEFAKEKDIKTNQLQDTVLKLGKKLDHHKQKNCGLNQKLKENANTIKVLLEKKICLQSQVMKIKGIFDKEREERIEEHRLLSQTKQIVALQEIQNKELRNQNSRLKQEILYLQSEIANFNEVRNKFASIQQIGEQQYQKQISLMKNQLEHQLHKNTHELFNSMTRELTLEDKSLSQTINRAQDFSLEKEELSKLANYIDYGAAYFLLQNHQLSQEASKKIYKFISKLAKELEQTLCSLHEEQLVSKELSQDLKDKISYFQEQINCFRLKQTSNKQTQTNQSTRVEEIVNANHFMRLKIYSMTKIIEFFSRFSIYLFRNIYVTTTKQAYYHFTETSIFPRKIKKAKFKSVCISILFTFIMKKAANKRKRMNIDDKFGRAHLSKYISNSHLSNLLHQFTISSFRKMRVKNYKIDQLLSERSQIVPNQRIIEIINQQYLNQGQVEINYSEFLNKFIYEKSRQMQGNY